MKEKVEEALDIKYKDEKIPKDVYDFDNILKNQYPNNNKNTLLKIAASFIVIILVLCGCATFVIRSCKENNIQEQATVDESVENGNKLPSYVATIDIQKISNSCTEQYYNREYICKLKVENILEYSFSDYNYPITKIRATVIENLSGNLNNEIDVWVPGGILKVSDIKNLDKVYYFYDDNIIDKYNDDDYVKVNYFENSRISEVQEGKIYISGIYMANNNEYYIDKNFEYGFREYDEQNNMVRNNDNQWKTLDIEKYLN